MHFNDEDGTYGLVASDGTQGTVEVLVQSGDIGHNAPVTRPCLDTRGGDLVAVAMVIGLSVFGSRIHKGPRLGDGAAYCVPDLTPHTLSP